MDWVGVTALKQSELAQAEAADVDVPEADELAASQSQSQGTAAAATIVKMVSTARERAEQTSTQSEPRVSSLHNILNDNSSVTTSISTMVKVQQQQQPDPSTDNNKQPSKYDPTDLKLGQLVTSHFGSAPSAVDSERLLDSVPAGPVRGGEHKHKARHSHKRGSASTSSNGTASTNCATPAFEPIPFDPSGLAIHASQPTSSSRRHSVPAQTQSTASASQTLLATRAASADAPPAARAGAAIPSTSAHPAPSREYSFQTLPHSDFTSEMRKKTLRTELEHAQEEEERTKRPQTQHSVAAGDEDNDEGIGMSRQERMEQIRLAKIHRRQQQQELADPATSQPDEEETQSVRDTSPIAEEPKRGARSQVTSHRLSDIADEESQVVRHRSNSEFGDIVIYDATQRLLEDTAHTAGTRHSEQHPEEPQPSSTPTIPTSSPSSAPDDRFVDAEDDTATVESAMDICAMNATVTGADEIVPPPPPRRETSVNQTQPNNGERTFPRVADSDDEENEDDDDGIDSEAFVAETLTASQHRVPTSRVGLERTRNKTSSATAPAGRSKKAENGAPIGERSQNNATSTHENSSPVSQRNNEENDSIMSTIRREVERHPDHTEAAASKVSGSSTQTMRTNAAARNGSAGPNGTATQAERDHNGAAVTAAAVMDDYDDGNVDLQNGALEEEGTPRPPRKKDRRAEVEILPTRPQAGRTSQTHFRPSATAYGQTQAPGSKHGKKGAASPRQQAKAKAARAAFAASPDRGEDTSKRKRGKGSEAEGRSTRRSSRRGGDAPSLKIGETFPLKQFDECMERAKAVIVHNDHVAHVAYDTIWLSEDQEFAETQAVMADQSAGYENTWQIIVYCRSCGKPPGRYMPRQSVPEEEVVLEEEQLPEEAVAMELDEDAPSEVFVERLEALEETRARAKRYFAKHLKDGYPNSACPAKVVFELQRDKKSYKKSVWEVKQVIDHCLECISEDINVGFHQSNRALAREVYFEAGKAQWESMVESVLEITNSFRKPPVLDDSGYSVASRSLLADIEEAEERPPTKRKKSISSAQLVPLFRPASRQPSGDLGDDEDEVPRHATPKSLKRKRSENRAPIPAVQVDSPSPPVVSDSVAGEDEPELEEEKPDFGDEERHDDDHYGDNVDHLMEHFESQQHGMRDADFDDVGGFYNQDEARSPSPQPEPTPKSKKRKMARSPTPRESATPPPLPKRSTRISEKAASNPAGKGKPPPGWGINRNKDNKGSATKAPKRQSRSISRHQEHVELSPETLIVELGLDQPVQTVLHVMEIASLFDLHSAMRGNNRLFKHDMDLTVEDLLLFVTKGWALESYLPKYKWDEEDDDDDIMPEDEFREWLRDKKASTRRLLLIARNAKVLTRAMQAIDWDADA